MSLSSLNSIGQTVFELESGKENVDGQMDGQTNRQNYTNFERNLALMVIYLPVKIEFDWTNRFRVRVQKRKMWTGRQTSRHINLTNPPKNSIRDARTPQPGEIVFNTMRYRSSETVQRSGYFQSSFINIKVKMMFT